MSYLSGKMVWRICCCCRRGNRNTGNNLNKGHEEIQVEVVDGNSLPSEESVWKVLGKKMSSWSLPKINRNYPVNVSEEFERQFDQYLAIDDEVDDNDDSDNDSNSSTLSQLLS